MAVISVGLWASAAVPCPRKLSPGDGLRGAVLPEDSLLAPTHPATHPDALNTDLLHLERIDFTGNLLRATKKSLFYFFLPRKAVANYHLKFTNNERNNLLISIKELEARKKLSKNIFK